jgi:predicted RNA-binding protein with TRAM domain
MYRDSGFEPRTTAPVNVGDELDVTIDAVGAKGDGIAKKDGFVLFVPNVQQGDNVRIRVTKVLRKVGFAEVVGSSDSSNGNAAEDSGSDDSSQDESSGEPEQPPQDSENFGEEDKN